jgi:thiamine pyrophosphate-dependent acetolactate synthase large subunit-like protein
MTKSPGDAERMRNAERPAGIEPRPAAFGSDTVADTLRALDIPFIALNPGASYRGFHDSLVNHLGNERPQILLCIHEEHAVAIAHGYAKVTGKPMAAAVHSNVGLFHATMAIFNAWCDRMPVIVLGATGPVDAAKRRPWIDWIHTAQDQGAIVRNYVKWDNQPASPAAAREALLRAAWIAQASPQGPVYINLDAEMQEASLPEQLPDIDMRRFTSPVPMGASGEQIAQAARLLQNAKRPLILAGRVSRNLESWNDRVQLAEALQARVATDLRVGAAFPTDHVLHIGAPAIFPSAQVAEAIRDADVILSLDWVDLGGAFKAACGAKGPPGQVIQISLDHVIHNGWSMDHQTLPPVDLFIAADPDFVASQLRRHIAPAAAAKRASETRSAPHQVAAPEGMITVEVMARALREAVGSRSASLLHVSLSWDGAWWPFRHPLDFLGSDGGGGIGGGPGIAVGAALALLGSGRLPVAVVGDGDFLMGLTAIWTAVHYRIPLLVVIANNRSFFNDELHQERVAKMRNRPVENKWIGQKMLDPEIDLAAAARAQGASGFGPVERAEDLVRTVREAIAAVETGGVAVVDVRVETGYTPAMAGALTRSDKPEKK